MRQVKRAGELLAALGRGFFQGSRWLVPVSMVATSAVIWAQELPMQPLRSERPFRESVTIAVDNDAAKMLRVIRDRWETGPDDDVLSQVVSLCETHGDALVLQDRGVSGGVARFVRVQAVCDELVSGLPAEKLARYREKIDPRAEPLWKTWESQHDPRALERLLVRASFSRRGDVSAWELGHWHWDRGDFAAARRSWRKLLPLDNADHVRELRFPQPSQPAGEVAARVLLCGLFLGETDHVAQSLADYTRRYPDVPGQLGGETGLWKDLLANAVKQAARWTPPSTSEDVPTYAGSQERQRIAPRKIDLGSELWSVPLRNLRLPEAGRPGVFPPPLSTAFHPAVIDDLVLLNDGRRIYGWNLYSGRPYWQPQRNKGEVLYPLVDDPSAMLPSRPVAGNPQWTMTVANGRLYARMGSAVATPAVSEFRDLPAELVCLDLTVGEGKLLWKLSGDELSELEGDLPAWRWEGSPVVEQGRVFVALSRRRPQLEWSIACLDAETGLTLWRKSVGISRPTPPEQENRVSQLLLTSGGGRLFLVTDWGSVVAIDQQDGQVQWAITYESALANGPRSSSPPAVYVDGRLYAALIDGDRLTCLDAATGKTVWSRNMPEPLRELLGVGRRRLIASGRSLWAFDIDTGAIGWKALFVDHEEWGYGRGALAGDQVLWTSRQSVRFFNQRTGELLREHPLLLPETQRTGGNLVVSHGVLLVAGAERLSAYGEYAQLREPLRQPLSDRSFDDGARLKLAEIEWMEGRHQAAAELWQEIRDAGRNDPVARSRGWSQRAMQRLAVEPGFRDAASNDRIVNPRIKPRPAQPISDARSVPLAGQSGYWRRGWHESQSSDHRWQIPQRLPDQPARWLVRDQSAIELLNVESGQTIQAFDISLPVRWTGETGDRLIVVTGDELIGWNTTTRTVAWRAPWQRRALGETHRSFSSTEWQLHPEGLLLWQPPSRLTMFDADDGRIRWQRDRQVPGWDRRMGHDAWTLALYDRHDHRLETLEAATGVTWFQAPGGNGPWKQPPVFTGRRADYVVVTEDRRVVFVVDGKPSWEFSNPIGHAHAEPWLFEHDGDWIGVFDGLRAVRIRTASGQPQWTASVAELPLIDPAQQTAMWRGRLIAAANGQLRATDLQTGGRAWQTVLSELFAARAIILNAAAEDATLAVIPIRESVPSLQHMPLFSAKTGRPRQTMALSEPTRYLDVVPTATGAVVIADGEVFSMTVQ